MSILHTVVVKRCIFMNKNIRFELNVLLLNDASFTGENDLVLGIGPHISKIGDAVIIKCL